MAHIPDNILDQILDRCNIAEVISGYIPLKRAGRNFRALCPFHHEKTPSFMVNPDKGIYHCFGCGAGGNAFSFVMKYERLEFPEAARMLAEKAGVPILEYTKDDSGKDTSLINGIYKAHELAAAYFQGILTSLEAKGVKEYLVKRGVKSETVNKFRIGFAPDSWDGLLGYLTKCDIAKEIIEKSGLIIPKQDGGGYYDRFRKRLMFPIFDQKDKVIAFGGRVLDDTLPKYMNSPETPIYNKSKTLFGLNFTKRHIGEKDAAVIVEGYTDLIIPYQNGINNLIASCGTSLTVDHIRLIRRHSRNIIMVYDSDKAGETATLRNLDTLLSEDMDVKIAEMPKGCDPDSFTRKEGAAAFEEILANPTGLFEYKLNRLLLRHKPDTIEVKVKVAGEMLVTISKVNNAVLRSAYIKRLAELLGLDENSLRSELAKPKKDYAASYSREAYISAAKADISTLSPADKTLIGLMVEDNTIIPAVKEKLCVAEFGCGAAQKIAENIFKIHDEKKPVSYACLISHLEIDGVGELLSDIASMQESLSDKKKNLDDCIKWLKKNNAKRDLEDMQRKIKAAQDTGEHGKVVDLVARYSKLMKESMHYYDKGVR
ncbi:MAG: DNA primase [Candidatus Omnitrophica bacterium]|nr:DNA primase [Candidatus Omnitrophota bacterium]MBU4488305.1 DNA primase [Candidatus Omnitrophota bacterium]MCG2705637.1 DNA primase [Candidatus Omnitrophota bacterium]